MFKRLSSVMLLAVLFVGAQAFFSCDLMDSDEYAPGNARPALAGYWKSSYGDGFEISGDTFTAYDDASKTISYAGTIVNDPDLDSNSAYLTLKITAGGTWGKTVGKYLTVHFKNYTGTTVNWASPYKSGASIENGADTVLQANMEFTVANGYFAMYGDYLKQ